MQFFDRLAELEREHATFAVATVVGRSAPVSSHLGDHALVFADGHMEGFVGGSCSRDVVRRQGLAAIASGKPRLLHIRPAPAESENADGNGEQVFVPMGCASEGAVDVYIEPHVPLRRLLVAGYTPVADALARIASDLDYAVARVVDADELRDVEHRPGVQLLGLADLPRYLEALGPLELARLVAVVASQGHYDEAALDVLARRDIAFLGLLASRKRAADVFGMLAQQGLPAERIATVRSPVGLDIGARSAGEVAVSILAEVIERGPVASAPRGTGDTRETATDPVCGMDVNVAGARHRTEHEGQSIVFCSARCAAAFAADPARVRAIASRA